MNLPRVSALCRLVVLGFSVAAVLRPIRVPAAPAPAQPATGAQLLEMKLSFLPSVVAEYDGKKLTAAAFRKQAAPQLMMLLSRNPRMPTAQLRTIVAAMVKQIVDRDLLAEIAAKAGFKPDIKKANAKLTDLARRFGGEKGLAKILAIQGLTRAEAVAQIAKDMSVSAWIDKTLRPKVTVSEAALKKYFAQHKNEFGTPEKVDASHILIACKANAPKAEQEKARKKAEAVLAKLKKGADFAEMAKKYSDCPSKARGGDLGMFGHGEMVPAFERAAFALKPGQLSGIVHTRFGYHIIKGGKHQKASAARFEDVKGKIRDKLTRGKLIALLQKRLDSARKAAKVKILVK